MGRIYTRAFGGLGGKTLPRQKLRVVRSNLDVQDGFFSMLGVPFGNKMSDRLILDSDLVEVKQCDR